MSAGYTVERLFSPLRCFGYLIVALVFSWYIAGHVGAQTRVWFGPDGGQYNNAVNWLPMDVRTR